MHATPLFVYDIRDGSVRGGDTRILEWLHVNGIEANDTYRFEIYSGSARVFQYDQDEQGYRFCPLTHEHRLGECEIARREPFDVAVSSVPPVTPIPTRGDR